ncbi:hypothetical protein EZS27_034891, partial [termite gut metagenome]
MNQSFLHILLINIIILLRGFS